MDPIDQTDRLALRIANAMRFYLQLHDKEKGVSWPSIAWDEMLEGVYRNYLDFDRAVEADDKREILAEGIGIINHVAMIIDNEASDELDAVQDFGKLLDEIRSNGEI